METLPRQKYTKEFRERAVRLVLEQTCTIPEAARRLAMSDKTLATGCFERGTEHSRGWASIDGPSPISRPRCHDSIASSRRPAWSATS